MKRKITSLFLVAGSVLTMNAQVMISEDFVAPWSPSANNWVLVNNSSPTTTPGQMWFSPTASLTFNAFNGAPNDYYAANWASTSNTVSGETISNWLITPTVNIFNGAVLSFATRTSTNPTTFPDRLEVMMSFGSGTNVGSTPTSMGTFSTLVTSVNPNLTGTGYPGQWTVYSTTLSGVTSPGVGRFGFRYHVPNGGFGGANSDYIGLDAVRYGSACNATVQSYTVCAGTSVTLTAVGAGTPAVYSWNPGAGTNSTHVVNPSSTTVYTLNYTEGGSTCTAVMSTVTIGNQLNVGINASSQNVCAGATATLTATGPANQYLWGTQGGSTPLGTTSSITVTPTGTTTYTLGGANGVCFGTASITINSLPNPTIVGTLSPTLVCQGAGFTLSATGGTLYNWVTTAGFTTVNPLALTAGAAGPRSYTILGQGTNGCVAGMVLNFTVNPSPTVTAAAGNSVVCTNNTVALTGSGASTYAWSGAGSSTSNPFTYTTGTTGGIQTFTVVGTNTAGCSSSASVAITVSVCNTNPVGVASSGVLVETAIFPNPFTSEIRINDLEGSVEIYNAIGQVVMSSQVEGSIALKTNDLVKGVYFVKAYNTSGEHVKTVRLLKN